MMEPYWEITESEAKKCSDVTTWYPAKTGAFKGGGFSSGFLTRGGIPMTMIRLNMVKGLVPVLQLAAGWTIDLPAKVYEILNERTNPTWPTHWFVPRLTGEEPLTDVFSAMSKWGANHCAISYGHIGAVLITLAADLRIPVCMHNIQKANIFRPSAWSAFGNKDPEGPDFRACANYGPLYLKY